MSGASYVCATCGQRKPIDQFAYKVRALGSRHTSCRDCVSAYNASYYAAHARRITKQAHGRKLAQKAVLRDLRTAFLTDRVCQECGRAPASKILPPRALTGGRPVADLIRNGWATGRFIAVLTAAEDAGGLLCDHCAGRRGASVGATAAAEA